MTIHLVKICLTENTVSTYAHTKNVYNTSLNEQPNTTVRLLWRKLTVGVPATRAVPKNNAYGANIRKKVENRKCGISDLVEFPVIITDNTSYLMQDTI